MTDPVKSCVNCPSFLATGPEHVSKFKKSIGAPMCAKYGHALGKPGLPATQADKLQRHFANNCDSYGDERPPLPVGIKLHVAMPDMEARKVAADDFKKDNCRTCASCTKFVREDIVADELGWTSGLCAAKGKLILSNRQIKEADGCEYREFGPVRSTTTNIHLLPEYESAFQLNVDPVRSYFKNKDEFVDPVDYETDREVTEEHVAAGIRAWRAIPDPDGSGREAFLPIFRVDFFSDEEQMKIPRTGDGEHPELYVDHFGGAYLAAVAWTELDETPALWGEAGTGKTELFRYLAWLMCLPFERISITASTEVDDLAGKMRYTDGKGTWFQYGRVPRAWTKPCVMVIDEPNVGPVDVFQFCRPMFDNSKQLVLDMNEAENLPRHDDCYVGVAMNPAWDTKNVGALPISDADANRLFHVFIEIPPMSLEREIIANRVRIDGWEISDLQLDMVMNIAVELRELAKDNTLPVTWALRPQIKVARALRWFDPITAYRRAVGDYLEPEAQDVLLDVVKSHVEGI
jgi:MoxR-like ATPase